MSRHPRDRRTGLSRREFLRRSIGAAVVLPSASAILAACSKPGSDTGGDGGETGSAGRVLARPDNPVTLPMTREPIPTDTPIESGPLRVYNWDAYMNKAVLKAFEEEYGVTVEVTTFNNMEEGIQKLVAGQVQADVFFPTTDYVSRLVEGDLLQPLNHELVPNLEANYWKVFSDPGPYYDLEWRYTVPYVIYTTGVGYRRDVIDDAAAAAAGYELFFDPQFKDAVSYYDSYRDALGMMLLRDGADVNSDDAAAITAAKDATLQMINDNGARLTINGAYAKLPEGEFSVAEAWSGDIVGAKWYPAERHPRGRPRLLVSAGQERPGRQRHDRHPGGRAEPSPRARIPELLPRRALWLHQLRRLERVPAADDLDRARTLGRRRCRPRVALARRPRRGELHARLHPG